MPSLVLLAIVAAGVLLTLRRWQTGLYFCCLIAALQDPIRKATAGSPAYLVLAFVPVYLAMAIRLFSRRNVLLEWRHDFPTLTTAFGLFGGAIVLSFLQTASYGTGAIPIAIVGAFSYAGGIPAVLLGFQYPQQSLREIDRVLLFYIGVTAVMLVSVPLEYLNIELPLPVLGTVGFSGNDWRRWYSDHDWIRMISGFYRSPEMMGWHAMCMVAFSVYFIHRRPAFRLAMIAVATWGGYCVLLSGRRKMYLMLLAFVVALVLLNKSWQRSRLIAVLLVACLVSLPAIYLFVDDGYMATAQTGLTSAGAKATEKGVSGPLWLLGIVGPFGYGVGTKSQGIQHLAVTVYVPNIEGGLEKVMVELGWLGVALGSYMLFVFARAMRRSLRQMSPYPDEHTVGVMLVSFLIACLGSFLVAFTAFGDPFVIFLVGFLAGCTLSATRLRRHWGTASIGRVPTAHTKS